MQSSSINCDFFINKKLLLIKYLISIVCPPSMDCGRFLNRINLMKSQDIYVLLKIVSLEHSKGSQLYNRGLSETAGWSSDDPDVSLPEISNAPFSLRALSAHTGIGKSEVGNSLRRSEYSGLCRSPSGGGSIKVNKKALLEFLVYGLKYVFPVRPGAMVRGIPTGFFAPSLSKNLLSVGEDVWVWPDAYGSMKGQAIEPLHSKVPKGVKIDSELYTLMALTDALRLGKPREVGVATGLLREKLR